MVVSRILRRSRQFVFERASGTVKTVLGGSSRVMPLAMEQQDKERECQSECRSGQHRSGLGRRT